MSDFWIAAALVGVIGVAQAGLNVAIGPLLLQSAPREMIGRVSSILNPTIMIATLVGAALGGYLDSDLLRGFSATVLGMRFGPVDTILTGAGVIALAGALFALVGLQGIRTQAQAQQPPAEEQPVVMAALPFAIEAEEPILR
jgi:MFS family permease